MAMPTSDATRKASLSINAKMAINTQKATTRMIILRTIAEDDKIDLQEIRADAILPIISEPCGGIRPGSENLASLIAISSFSMFLH